MKSLVLLPMIVFLFSGCAAVMAGASVGSTAMDRYEKYQIEKRIEELEKELTRRCKCTM